MKTRIKLLSGWYFSRQAAPYWFVLIIDCIVVFLSGLLSYYFVYGGYQFMMNFWPLVETLLIFLPGYILGFRIFRSYTGIIRYTSSVDLLRVAGAMSVGCLVGFVLHRTVLMTMDFYNIRALVLLLLFFIATCICVGFRIAIKFLYDTLIYSNNQVRAFVYGVHEGGESLARNIMSAKDSPYVLSGFISDEKNMIHHSMLGVRVYYLDEDIVETMRRKHVRVLFVSPLRSDALRQNPEFVNKVIQSGIKVMMQPAEQEWDGKSDLSTLQLREVDIEDLLPRDKIEVDLDAIGRLLKDQVVMVTGAAGSIGYEMVLQVAKFAPKHLVLIDQAETPMHNVRLHMASHCPDLPCETIVASISNLTKMESVFATYRPDYVFHAAAYKHVPMMEDNPAIAVQNNVYGTRVIADLSVKYGAKKFVMISTDKAVNPTNVMGCSKRICEIYCQALNKALVEFREKGTCEDSIRDHLVQSNGEPGITQFVTTRFGNVLGSNGSVIPLFKKQIANGGPITVTHPDIIRYFMLIPEACRLVLEAGTLGNGGEIFIFDMGKPVRIVDLAQRMIALSGAKNVEIKFTGLREGEKLYEEVLNDAEQTKETPHPKIKVSAVREYPYALALKNEEELHQLSFTCDDMEIVRKMKEIVPEYKSRVSKYEILD